jgi:hypothetical protein
MFSPLFYSLSQAQQFPSFVPFSDECSIIRLSLIGLDLSKQMKGDGKGGRRVLKSTWEMGHRGTEGRDYRGCSNTQILRQCHVCSRKALI